MDGYIGEIRAFGFDFAPQDWAYCNGAQLQARQNQVLYAIIGTMYGGNTTTQVFNLPDLQGCSTVGIGTGPGLSPYVLAQKRGAETVTLTGSELPDHTHQFLIGGPAIATNETAAPDAKSYISRYWDTGPNPDVPLAVSVQNTEPNTIFAPGMLNPTGSNGPHENRQPLLVMNFCICTNGVFPVPAD